MKLRTQTLEPFLLEAQNSDGGWGYQPSAASATEPTSWALQALSTVAAAGTRENESGFSIADRRMPIADDRCSRSATDNRQSAISQAVNVGGRWLHDAQLPDGSWPAFVGQPQGCWVTAAACLALNGWQESSDRIARGLRWLCRTWPAEGNLWWRFRQRLWKQASAIRQDSSLRGWSWTPGTASWVEPTAYALIAFRCIPKKLHPPGVSKRRQLGEKMLYDRMCPGGGWNSGNPLVYGVAGEPRVGPTAWALLALQDYRDRPENLKSVDWLEQVYPHIRGPASLVVARLCLEAYDRPLPPLEPALSELWLSNQFFRNVLVAAWAAMALSGGRDQEFGVTKSRK